MQNFEVTITEVEENPEDSPIVGWVRVPVRLRYFPGRKKNWLGFMESHAARLSANGKKIADVSVSPVGKVAWDAPDENITLTLSPGDYGQAMGEMLGEVSKLKIRKENPDVSIQEGTGEAEGV